MHKPPTSARNELNMREALREREIMITGADPIQRAFLLSLVGELGFDTRKIYVVKDATDALQLTREIGISMVLYDDSLGLTSLSVIQAAMAEKGIASPFVFVVSQDMSQAAVGQFVEMEVNGYCLTPFSGEEFKTAFLEAFSQSYAPDEYQRLINLGKTLLYEGAVDEAARHFDKAKTLNPTPAVAHFYCGQVKLIKKLLEESRQEFVAGIASNQIHFRCLQALFGLLHMQKRTEESYEVLRRLVGIFPENVERLMLAIRLAVNTRNFLDLSTWYEVYECQTEKSDEMKKHITAALSVFGRYLLMSEKKNDAMMAFERALAVSPPGGVFVEYAAESLTKYGYPREAERLRKVHSARLYSIN